MPSLKLRPNQTALWLIGVLDIFNSIQFIFKNIDIDVIINKVIFENIDIN